MPRQIQNPMPEGLPSVTAGLNRAARTQALACELRPILNDIDLFTRETNGLTLRHYQQGVAQAIHASIQQKAGRTFVVMFPRQSGKNELQAQLETYLLTILFNVSNAEMIKVSPTWKPQTLNAMRRLERVLEKNCLTRRYYLKESGYIYRMGNARIYFFSGQPRANIVGATANVLLEVDEAQDVLISKYDKEIAPMAASTNATRVLWGTAWTGRTLLARELRAARELQKQDGIQRVFVMTADDVAREVPAYGSFVTEQVARLGRNHPMVRTQYFCEEIDAEGGLFPPERQALMRGRHAPEPAPLPGAVYAMTLDVAGEDESATQDSGDLMHETLLTPRRDSTALTVFRIDFSTVEDPLIRRPSYLVALRKQWNNVRHSTLYGAIKAMADLYRVRWLVVDCTGVGAGLTSFLSAALPDRVIPFEFNSRTKSDLLWNFLGIIDSGRFKDAVISSAFGFAFQEKGKTTPADKRPQAALSQGAGAGRVGDDVQSSEQSEFWRQVNFCEFEILPGPQKMVRWGVPDGTRDPADGSPVHDDLLVSAAMVAVLDEQEWTVPTAALIIQNRDPLEELDRGF